MELEPFGQLGQGRLRRLAARVGDEPDHVRLILESTVALELRDRVQLPARRGHGSLEVRGLGVQHTVELAAKGAGSFFGSQGSLGFS